MLNDQPLDSILSHVLPLIISVCALACVSATMTPNSHQGAVVYFGDGGGFTGAVQEFALLDNGIIFEKGPSDTSFVQLGSVDKKIAQQMIKNYHFQQIDQIKLNKPGNRYYFLKHKDHTIVYDPYSKTIPSALEQYIHTLNGLVRKIKAT